MPIHDWTRTYAGVFHQLHVAWLVEIARVLNNGLLPSGYYALVTRSSPVGSGLSSLPAATITAVAESPRYPPRPRVIAVRHRSGDRLVAMIEIVSAGNKTDAADIGSLVEKTVVALSKGIQ